VIIVENNRWAYSTPVSRQSRLTDLADKARAHGIPRGVADGNDVLAVHEATSRAAAIARRGEGPVILECKTMRMKGHSEHDDAWYVPRAELEFWKKRDPILLLERRLRKEGFATGTILKEIEQRCQAEIEAALQDALSAPLPASESCLDEVYAPPAEPAPPALRSARSGGKGRHGGRG
jgi:pyruvate dehydrogenase E1 component alpha subunit